MDNLKYFAVVASLLSLTACRGGSDSTDANAESDAANSSSYTYSGSLVIPRSVAAQSARALNRDIFRPFSAECPNVPDGYEPMANAKVTLEDSSGTALGAETTTDNCGVFTLTVPQADVTGQEAVISASLDGYKTLKAHADNFVQAEGDAASTVIASTIPASASYIISAIQKASGDELMFSVTDSSTNNAVIQLTKAAFSVSVNDQPIAISTLNSSDQLGVASSNALALDGSFSMTDLAYTVQGTPVKDVNGTTYTLHRLTALAAHQFASEKSATDEVAIIPFDSKVNLLTNQFLSEFDFVDNADNSVTYDYSDSGFVVDKAKLHFAIDMYNPHSGLWIGQNPFDQTHADRSDDIVSTSSDYEWGGGTELEGAINSSLDALITRNNTIKRAFVMTDGESPFSDRVGLIDMANQNSIPVHSIALGADADEEDLKAISEQTGGTYYKVINTSDIVGIYSSLQTTIKYAYLAALSTPLQAGDVVKLSLEINGETVTRELTIQ